MEHLLLFTVCYVNIVNSLLCTLWTFPHILYLYTKYLHVQIRILSINKIFLIYLVLEFTFFPISLGDLFMLLYIDLFYSF